mmetsp:Transcript_34089/g.119182  ORF Transcript_34089/g.119182 Transcript_34089/m.119182 type:complete len:169 (-) Transcript_34089:79-585(-)
MQRGSVSNASKMHAARTQATGLVTYVRSHVTRADAKRKGPPGDGDASSAASSDDDDDLDAARDDDVEGEGEGGDGASHDGDFATRRLAPCEDDEWMDEADSRRRRDESALEWTLEAPSEPGVAPSEPEDDPAGHDAAGDEGAADGRRAPAGTARRPRRVIADDDDDDE